MIPYLVAAMVKTWPAVISTGKMKKVEQNRSKTESLMGTLKRRLSAEQKQKSKGSTPSGSSAR